MSEPVLPATVAVVFPEYEVESVGTAPSEFVLPLYVKLKPVTVTDEVSEFVDGPVFPAASVIAPDVKRTRTVPPVVHVTVIVTDEPDDAEVLMVEHVAVPPT